MVAKLLKASLHKYLRSKRLRRHRNNVHKTSRHKKLTAIDCRVSGCKNCPTSHFAPLSMMPGAELPGEGGWFFETGAGADDAADAQGLRMAGDLVGEDLDVAEDAVQARHHPRHLTRHVVKVAVKARVGEQALQRAIAAADRVHQIPGVGQEPVPLVRALFDVLEDRL